MKRMVKKLTVAAMAVVMVMGMSVIASAGAAGDTCYHTTLTAAIEGPYHDSYYGQHTLDDGRTCTITQRVGVLRYRCTYCGAIVNEVAYTIPTKYHSISHS